MDKQQITALLKRYSQGQCTEREKVWVETWYLNQHGVSLSDSIEELSKDLDELEQKLIDHITIRRIKIWPRIAAAASILFFLSVGGYFFLHKLAPQQLVENNLNKEIYPGSNKAILTLSNGRQLNLSDAHNGIISKDAGSIIKKTSDGNISYDSFGAKDNDLELAYNQITTPRGGQWSAILPDGTKVMLDAESAIKYPLRFGKERKVEVTGQVYFEVVHNAAKPFLVITKTQVIEDLGTIFNVNAYDDETFAKTTLLEGAVKVYCNPAAQLVGGKGVMLKPGQEAILQNNKLSVTNANLADVFAWKNGYFIFNDEGLESIMRKLSRWYNIDVKYQGELPNITFNGEIPRNTSLSQVLQVLEEANVHFILDGKRLTVTY